MTPTERRGALATFLAEQLRALNKDISAALPLADSIMAKVPIGKLFGDAWDSLDKSESAAALMTELAEQAAAPKDAPTEKPKPTTEQVHGQITALVVARLKADGLPTKDGRAIAWAIFDSEDSSVWIDENSQLDAALAMTRFGEIMEAQKPKPIVQTPDATPTTNPDWFGESSQAAFLKLPPEERLRRANEREHTHAEAKAAQQKKAAAASALDGAPDGFLSWSPELRNTWYENRKYEAAQKKAAA